MSREFRLILRVLGADVDGTKKVPFGLSKIRGVGPNFAQAVVKVARISPEARIGSLSEAEISRLEDIIKDPAKHGIPARMFNRRKDIESGRDMHLVGPDLALRNKADIDLMKLANENVVDAVIPGSKLREELSRRLAFSAGKDRTPIPKHRPVIPV